jgi:DNA-binding NarL/FixJ family response regulator
VGRSGIAQRWRSVQVRVDWAVAIVLAGVGLADAIHTRVAEPPATDELTPRELEVLGLIARGFSNADIARELVVSDATVKPHVARIFSKLGLHDRAQAVVLAYESGLVQPGAA